RALAGRCERFDRTRVVDRARVRPGFERERSRRERRRPIWPVGQAERLQIEPRPQRLRELERLASKPSLAETPSEHCPCVEELVRAHRHHTERSERTRPGEPPFTEVFRGIRERSRKPSWPSDQKRPDPRERFQQERANSWARGEYFASEVKEDEIVD